MAILTFTIPGELADLNAFIGEINSHRYQGSKLKKDETERVAWIVKGKRIEEYPVHIVFDWHCKDKRKDKDNIAFAKKFVLDGLVMAGALPNDGWRHVAGFTDNFKLDKENPRIEVTITKHEE